MEYQHFLNIFGETLNKHASAKQKYPRGNQAEIYHKRLTKDNYEILYI